MRRRAMPTERTAVAERCDTRPPHNTIQFTKSRAAACSSRRFGMDAEPCGCALLADKNGRRGINHHMPPDHILRFLEQ